jgi:aldehyde:ferredoxin oxidoreductase
MFGYAEKILKVNLTTKIIDEYILSKKAREMFIGGKTLAAKIIFEFFNKKVEALSEENIIVITNSPLTATSAPSSSRFNVSTISPLTGLLISSNCGGNFGFHLKRAGYDGIIIIGKSEEKVYIDILNEKVEIKSAGQLWGKNTGETQQLMGEKNRGKLVIGRAGENLVKYAAVISEERAIGRGGIGAVFGYKNLKGLIVSGNKNIELYDKEKFIKHTKNWTKNLKKHPLTGEQLPKLGSGAILTMMHYRNLLTTKNYSRGNFEDFEKINAETMRKEHLVKNKGCISCPIQCARVVKAYGKEVKGPELETLALLGSNLENNDLQSIINLNHLCDEYGIDTITFGSTIGFAMELNEKGIWKNGLNFKDVSDLENILEKIANREGIGDELAEGTKKLSEKYGGKDFAINVKGLELAAYEPRAAQGMGLGYATSNRGGCHLNGGYMVIMEGLGLNVNGKTTKGKAAFTIFFQDFMEAVSAGGTCLFSTYSVLPAKFIKKPNSSFVRFVNKLIPYFGPLVGFLHNNSIVMSLNMKNLMPYPYALKMSTGFKMNIGKFLKAGERGYNLERLINIRQGLKGDQDTLPKRLTKELQRLEDKDSKVKLEKMINKYYKIRGWDENGVPTKKRLEKLGIGDYKI